MKTRSCGNRPCSRIIPRERHTAGHQKGRFRDVFPIRGRHGCDLLIERLIHLLISTGLCTRGELDHCETPLTYSFVPSFGGIMAEGYSHRKNILKPGLSRLA